MTDGLTTRDRRLVALSCAGAAGTPERIEDAVAAALAQDVSAVELREAVLHLAVYIGWPRGAMVNQAVEAALKAALVAVPEQGAGLPLPGAADPAERIAGGEAMFREVNALPYAPGTTLPYTGAGVTAFVFGEVWHRPGLARRDRRLLSLPAAAYVGAWTPIVSHVYGALKSGDLSDAAMDEVVDEFAQHAGASKAELLADVVADQRSAIAAEQT